MTGPLNGPLNGLRTRHTAEPAGTGPGSGLPTTTPSLERSLERSLPIRVEILPGEALDSWLEALARRNNLPVRQLLHALQTPGVHSRRPGRVARLDDATLRKIERQTGLTPGRLNQAVLDRYLPVTWPLPQGTRFCPHCLADSAGRWPLNWRLTWVFACTRHQVLLRDTCPACGQPPRAKPAGLGTRPKPPGTCLACNTDLTAHLAVSDPGTGTALEQVQELDSLLLAQQEINTWLATPETTPETIAETMSSPVSVNSPLSAPLARFLTDLRTVAGWLARHATTADFAPFGTAVQQRWRNHLDRIGNGADNGLGAGPGHRISPADSAVVGALASWALEIINGGAEGHDRVRQIRASQMPPEPGEHRPRRSPIVPHRMDPRRWRTISEPTQRTFLKVAEPQMPLLDRIRYRAGSPRIRVPSDSPDTLTNRLRHTPQTLWPEWTIRLLPTEGFASATFGPAIAACLQLPGNRDARISAILAATHPHRSTLATMAILRALAEHRHQAVFTAVGLLADYLDNHGSPIDYARRRAMITPAAARDLITAAEWESLSYQAGAHPGGRGTTPSRRHLDAQRYLYQLLTGADLTDDRHELAFRNASDRSTYLAFSTFLTTPLRQALHTHAARQLHALGIEEPLTWAPPADCCAGLNLPGRDPADIDTDTLKQLIETEALAPGDAAAQLGTTIDHVRYALERIHRPARIWGHNAAPTAWQTRRHADRILTREFFEREYAGGGKNLRQIQHETSIHRKLLAHHARQNGITLAKARPRTPISEDWLREQYVHRERSFTDIAAELGVKDMTVIRAARRYNIASRPTGITSHPDLIAKLSDDIPHDIRRAVEGQLHGWQRLHRFQQAMAHPTLRQAAEHLGAYPSALIKQLQRLERDIGADLFHRATYQTGGTTTAQRPTKRGDALLQALNRPDVQALLDHAITRGKGQPDENSTGTNR